MPNDLIPAGTDTQSPATLRVGEPEKFPLKEPAAPAVDTGVEKHYMCSMPFASMHRKDGIRIGFIHGHFSSKMKADQQYLDEEIALGHPNIRHANSDEIRNAMIVKDPIGTLRKEIAAENQVDKEEMEANLRKKLLAELEGAGVVLPAVFTSGKKEAEDNRIYPTTTITPTKSILPGTKSAVELIREKIASGSGTLTMVSGNGASTLNPVSSKAISEGADG